MSTGSPFIFLKTGERRKSEIREELERVKKLLEKKYQSGAGYQKSALFIKSILMILFAFHYIKYLLFVVYSSVCGK